jgi:hypothetical protein
MKAKRGTALKRKHFFHGSILPGAGREKSAADVRGTHVGTPATPTVPPARPADIVLSHIGPCVGSTIHGKQSKEFNEIGDVVEVTVLVRVTVGCRWDAVRNFVRHDISKPQCKGIDVIHVDTPRSLNGILATAVSLSGTVP